MSGHGRSILGATFQRTTGIVYSSITARQHLRHPCFAISQVSAPITRGIPLTSTISFAQKTVSHGKFICDSPHHAVTAIINRPPKLFIPVFERPVSRTQDGPRLRVAPLYQSTHIRTFRGQRFIERHVNSQRRRYSNKPAGLYGKGLEKDAVSRASESPKASPGPMVGKHLIDRLPSIPQVHRPNKEELLAAATGFWSRLKVRFKWFSIRSGRPFNIDEISAFFSWVLLGHVLWIVLGTTTFFSLAILAVNTVFAQETLARWIGNYLTRSSGVRVVFESAIVPKWGDGVITFKNVFVSRRPGQGSAKVSKGSPVVAAASAKDRAKPARTQDSVVKQDEDTNYTQFDLSLDTINVTLSFTKWFNSKGLLRDVEVKGVRGIIDRTSIKHPTEPVDPRTYKHEHNPGDFEIDSFKLEDLLVTVQQPDSFRPFSISIFSCDLPKLRRQWLFYDFLSANTMSGSYDESLFTIHPRQTHGPIGSQLGGEPDHWKKQSRLRIDGLNINHLNHGVDGPFSWIHEGNVDIVADIMFPADSDESIAKVMSDFYDRMEATVTAKRYPLYEKHSTPVEKEDTATATPVVASTQDTTSEDDKRFLVMDLRVHLNDVRAAVPLFNNDLSYVNNALIRPIVAYINSRRTFIPIHCRVVKRASEFDGSWTVFDSGLMDDLSAETYDAIDRKSVV